MKATSNGFIYNKESKEVLTEVFTGDGMALPITHDVFYGTKSEAVVFGLVFLLNL